MQFLWLLRQTLSVKNNKIWTAWLQCIFRENDPKNGEITAKIVMLYAIFIYMEWKY